MFENIDDVYEFIGQEIFNSMPDEWLSATSVTLLDNGKSGVMSQINLLKRNASCSEETFRFDSNAILPLIEAYKFLFTSMRRSEQDIPWNKARFKITSDGDFEVDFKYDEDFAWYQSLDIDSQEYDDLDIDIINQIKTWEGLPEEAPRYWLKK